MASISGELNSITANGRRGMVEQMKFNGHDIDIWMGKGWFFKTFSIHGSEEAVAIVYKALENWRNRTEQEK